MLTLEIFRQYLTPPSTSTLKQTLKGIWRMFSTYPYWDVSYLVAVVFTLGSVVWCINAFFVWLPLQDPSTEFNGEIADAGGWTAFVGATIFEFGSILLMIEAVNENRADCFGWALEEALEEKGLMRLKPGACIHHHKNKGNLVGKGKGAEGKERVVLPFSFHNSRSTSRLVVWDMLHCCSFSLPFTGSPTALRDQGLLNHLELLGCCAILLSTCHFNRSSNLDK